MDPNFPHLEEVATSIDRFAGTIEPMIGVERINNKSYDTMLESILALENIYGLHSIIQPICKFPGVVST